MLIGFVIAVRPNCFLIRQIVVILVGTMPGNKRVIINRQLRHTYANLSMIENLPFSALRVFECAARHLSFKRAAQELYITPAAVSQQIKTLEHQLGVKLFNRLNRGLSLTDEAIIGLPTLIEGFDNIVDSVHRMRCASEDATLTVWMAPSFAAKWLIPRLHRFSEAYPGIDLNISASRKLIDLNTTKNTIPAENCSSAVCTVSTRTPARSKRVTDVFCRIIAPYWRAAWAKAWQYLSGLRCPSMHQAAP